MQKNEHVELVQAAINTYADLHEIRPIEALGFLARRIHVGISLQLLGLPETWQNREAFVQIVASHGFRFLGFVRAKNVRQFALI